MTTADLDLNTTRRRRPATRAGVAPAREGLALVVVTVLAIIMPFGFFVGDTYLTPSRLLFLFTVPYLGMRLMAGAYGPRLLTDYMVFGYAVWMMIALALNHQAQALTLSVSNALVMLGGYLAGRVGIRSLAQMQGFARFYAWVVLLMLPIALADSLSGQIVVAEMLRNLDLGWLDPVRSVEYPPRFGGLNRAQVFFVHPIHFGLFAAFPVGLYYVGLRSLHSAFHRTVMSVLIIGTCFCSLSSGPFLAAVFQALLIGYMLVTEHMKNQWKLILWSFAALYAVLEVLSTRSAIFAIAERLAFSSGNAYFRRELFNVGIDQVQRTPIFGIGLRRPVSMPGWMTSTFDNYWLAVAVANGLPAFIFCAVAFLYPMIRAGRGEFRKGSDLYNMRVGWTITMIGMILALATVTVWNQLFSTVFLVLGAGQFLLIQKEPDPVAQERDATDRQAPGQIRYSRFSGPPARPARSQPPVRARPAAGARKTTRDRPR
jgi:hypothetical protein